jgi:hypothetical protein
MDINEPIWVDQWPLLEQKLQQTHILVQQVKTGHLKHSNSPWNSPIFYNRKKGQRKT